MPASASTSPVRGSHRGDAAVAAGERLDAARWISGSIVVRTAPAGLRLRARRARGRRPTACRRAAGEALLEHALEPGEADRRVRREAARAQRAGALGRGGAERGRRSPPRPRGRRRCGPSPLAIALPSRAWIVARGGSVVCARELLAGAQAGEDGARRARRRRIAVAVAADRQLQHAVERAEDARADRHVDAGSRRRRGRRPSRTTSDRIVAVSAARAVGARRSPGRGARLAPRRRAARTCARSRRAPSRGEALRRSRARRRPCAARRSSSPTTSATSASAHERGQPATHQAASPLHVGWGVARRRMRAPTATCLHGFGA